MRIAISTVVRLVVIYLMLVLTLVLSTLISYSTWHYSEETVQVIEELKKLEEAVLNEGPSAIFLNNLKIALVAAIPFLGPAFMVYSCVSTGYVLGVDIAYEVNAQMLDPTSRAMLLAAAIISVTVFPHAILEYLAYTLATDVGVTLSWRIIRKMKLDRQDMLSAILKVVLAVALLALAAIVEYYTILSLSAEAY